MIEKVVHTNCGKEESILRCQIRIIPLQKRLIISSYYLQSLHITIYQLLKWDQSIEMCS